MGWFQRIFWTLAGAGGVYVAAILALTIPTVQRNATYAHKVNPARWQNLSDVEQFGFFHHQVQPFTVRSTNNVTLFAWHIMPTHLYRKHEKALIGQQDFGLIQYEKAAHGIGLRLLLEDPRSHVVVSFHGNAAHIASSYRPQTYQQILSTSTAERPVHVIAFDYRGFGLSTGSPDEAGVIEDGLAIVSALCGETQSFSVDQDSKKAVRVSPAIKPSQIILIGQSLGTFVSTATFYDWVVRLGNPPFKALFLLASFSSLPKLLDTYSIKGFTPPLLSPLMQYPWLQRWILSKIADRWETSVRLMELIKLPQLPLDLTIMHAENDWEIPHHEGHRNWEAVLTATNNTGILEEDIGRGGIRGVWRSDDGKKRVKWEKVKHGGHNRIPTSEQMKKELLDVLDRKM